MTGPKTVSARFHRVADPNLAVRGNDDPRLDLSIVSNPDRQPWRVVIDSNAKTPADANVCNDAAPTLIVVADDADASHLDGVIDVLRVRRAERGLDLSAVMRGLLARDILCDYRPDAGVRLSPHCYSTEEECDRAIAAMVELRARL